MYSIKYKRNKKAFRLLVWFYIAFFIPQFKFGIAIKREGAK